MDKHLGEDPEKDPCPPNLVEVLLVDLLDRIEREGPEAVGRMLRAHPREAPMLLQRLRLLVAMGLLNLELGEPFQEGEEEATW